MSSCIFWWRLFQSSSKARSQEAVLKVNIVIIKSVLGHTTKDYRKLKGEIMNLIQRNWTVSLGRSSDWTIIKEHFGRTNDHRSHFLRHSEHWSHSPRKTCNFPNRRAYALCKETMVHNLTNETKFKVLKSALKRMRMLYIWSLGALHLGSKQTML